MKLVHKKQDEDGYQLSLPFQSGTYVWKGKWIIKSFCSHLYHIVTSKSACRSTDKSLAVACSH